MKIFFMIYLISIVAVLSILAIDEFIVQRIRNNSKFKTWWRNSVVGEMDPYDNP